MKIQTDWHKSAKGCWSLTLGWRGENTPGHSERVPDPAPTMHVAATVPGG